MDGILYNPNSTYVVVHRDPRDVLFSLRNHMDNLKRIDYSLDPEEDVSALFREWVRTPASNDGGVQRSLEQIIIHFQSYKRFEQLANIHMFHYADLKANLPAAVAAMAGVLGVNVTAEDITEISRLADFKNMRDNAAQFAPLADDGLWKSNENFFNKGTSGQWRDVLNAEDLALYDERMSTLLPAEDIAWLHNGTSQ